MGLLQADRDDPGGEGISADGPANLRPGQGLSRQTSATDHLQEREGTEEQEPPPVPVTQERASVPVTQEPPSVPLTQEQPFVPVTQEERASVPVVQEQPSAPVM